MSSKKRSRSETEGCDAVSDGEREAEDTEEEEDDWSSDFDPDMVCLLSMGMGFSITLPQQQLLVYYPGHKYKFQTCVSMKPGKPTHNVSLLACSHS